MIAREIVTTDILPLKPQDNAGQAMTMMSIYHIGDIPVVKDGELLGMVSEDDVSSVEPDKLISSFRLTQSYIFVSEDAHVFEILGKLAECKISVIPVLSKSEKYLGVITETSLIKYYADTYSFTEPGSIIVIKVGSREYSLSEMTRVIEMEGGKIMSSFITSLPSSDSLLVTLKIKQQEMNQILQALERYDYDIHATFAEEEYHSDLKNRYDMLMTYLNV